MPLILADRIRENTTTVGSGVLNLVGNTDGFRRFGDVLSSGDITYYCIEENNKFEVGIGTYGFNSINRDYILQSSDSGSKINLGGSGVVFLTYPADKAVIKDEENRVIIGLSGLVFSDGSVQKTASKSIGDFNYVSGVSIYASGQSVLNQSNISINSDSIVATSGIANYASGLAITNEYNILSVSGWSSVNGVNILASAQSYADTRDIAVSGWSKSYIDSQDHSGIAVSGWANSRFLTINNGVYLSGIAAYASGQSVYNQSEITAVSGWATSLPYNDTYLSGIANYASGQSIINEDTIIAVSGWTVGYIDSQDHTGIATSGWALSTFSTNQDLNYVSGISIYSSGQTILNSSGITYISGIATYVSGNALYNIIEDDTPQLGGNLDLNNHNINGTGNAIISGNITAISGILNQLVFNTSLPDPDLLQGQLQWNSTEGTLDLGLNETYAIHIGEEMLYRVRNITGSTLLAGQPVYASGLSPGANNRIEVNLHVADGSIREVRFMGLITENLLDNGNNGYATHFGYIRKIDTRGNAAVNGTTNKLWTTGEPEWYEGDILYVHPTVAGKLTKIEPKHSISVAIITSKGTNGKIFVRPTSYGHLDDNHDVAVSGATNGQFLQYNSVTDYWVPSSSGNFTSLFVNGTGVSITGHTHTSSNISDFNTAVSGLLPVKNIIAGTDINITSNNGVFTINSTASGGGGSTTDQIHPFLLGGM